MDVRAGTRHRRDGRREAAALALGQRGRADARAGVARAVAAHHVVPVVAGGVGARLERHLGVAVELEQAQVVHRQHRRHPRQGQGRGDGERQKLAPGQQPGGDDANKSQWVVA